MAKTDTLQGTLTLLVLHRMEQEGWIKAEWGVSDTNRRARFYSLTVTGRKQLAQEEQNWSRLTNAVGLVLKFT
jgi:PadR family transcriptional regulator PadR